MANEPNSTQPSEGDSANAEPQAQVIEGQPSEPEQIDGQTQVDSPESQASSQKAGGGRKASGYYAERDRYRRRIDSLENEINTLKSITQKPVAQQSQPQTSAEQAQKEFWNNFINDPHGVLQKLVQDSMQQEVPKIAKGVYEEGSRERLWQDAEKLITANPAYTRDPDIFVQKIKDISNRYGIVRWADQDPTAATELALQIYSQETASQREVRQPNPNAPKKSQMVNTATGSPAMTSAPNRDALITELRKMQQQLVDNIELRNDPKFQERFKAIRDGLMPAKK